MSNDKRRIAELEQALLMCIQELTRIIHDPKYRSANIPVVKDRAYDVLYKRVNHDQRQ